MRRHIDMREISVSNAMLCLVMREQSAEVVKLLERHGPCDFYLWVQLKCKVFSNNPLTLAELQQNTENAIAVIPQKNLSCCHPVR